MYLSRRISFFAQVAPAATFHIFGKILQTLPCPGLLHRTPNVQYAAHNAVAATMQFNTDIDLSLLSA